MIKKHVARSGAETFQAYSSASGKKRYLGTFATERLAEEAIQDHQVRQRAVKRGDAPAESDERRTLTAACKLWLASLTARNSRSREIYRRRLNLYVLPRIGSMPIELIQTRHVMDLRDALSGTVSPATVNGAIMTLSSAFTHFRKRQWVARNPCADVELLETPDRLRDWIHTSEEMGRLVAACDGDLRDMAILLLGAGLRLDELIHLQWADVDLSKRLIHVNRGKNGPPKGGRLRHVPILNSTLPMLRRRALRREGSLLVFPSPQRPGPRGPDAVRQMFKRAFKRAGLPTSLTVHGLRHTFASHWVMNGGDIWRLSKVLGHKSVTVTERYYAHLRPDVFTADYDRVSFVDPDADGADVVPFRKNG